MLCAPTSSPLLLTHLTEDDDQLMERWPRLMTARTAAAYCDERSSYSFRKAVGRLWPQPIKVPGKGAQWLKEDLDFAIDRLKSGGRCRGRALGRPARLAASGRNAADGIASRTVG
jgi:hypothetical protein